MRRGMICLLVLGLLCMTGCQKADVIVQDTAASTQNMSIEAYLTGVKEQSAAIKATLEQEALTQTEMNLQSKELADLWDAALAYVLDVAEKQLPESEWSKLTAEQSAWMTEKANAVEAAGKETEGGSMHALIVNVEAAALTEARVLSLAETLSAVN